MYNIRPTSFLSVYLVLSDISFVSLAVGLPSRYKSCELTQIVKLTLIGKKYGA